MTGTSVRRAINEKDTKEEARRRRGSLVQGKGGNCRYVKEEKKKEPIKSALKNNWPVRATTQRTAWAKKKGILGKEKQKTPVTRNGSERKKRHQIPEKRTKLKRGK